MEILNYVTHIGHWWYLGDPIIVRSRTPGVDVVPALLTPKTAISIGDTYAPPPGSCSGDI